MNGQSKVGRKGFVLDNLGCGAILGGILILGFLVIFAEEEARSDKLARALKECRGKVVSVAPDKIDPANEGKLIHLVGTTTTGSGTVPTDDLGVTAQCLVMNRNVLTYQWDEICEETTENWSDGRVSTNRTYSHQKIWWHEPINSASFSQPAGHENLQASDSLPPSWSSGESHVSLGSFTLDPVLLEKVLLQDFLPLDSVPPAILKMTLNASPTLFHGWVVIGSDSQNPQIGDRGICYYVVKPRTFSLVGKQTGTGVSPFKTENGCDILILSEGVSTPDQIFSKAEKRIRFFAGSKMIESGMVIAFGFFLIFWSLEVTDFSKFIPGRIPRLLFGFVSRFPSLTAAVLMIMVPWGYFHSPNFKYIFPAILMFFLIIRVVQYRQEGV